MTGREHLLEIVGRAHEVTNFEAVPEHFKSMALGNWVASATIARAGELIRTGHFAEALDLISCADEALRQLLSAAMSHPEVVELMKGVLR